MISGTIIASTESSLWAAVGIKDEQTGRLSYLFTFPVGDGTVGSLELGNELSHSQMAQRLRGQTTLLPTMGAAKFIEDLILGTAARFIIKTRSPGWKRGRADHAKSIHARFAAFVTPGQILGPEHAEYCWAIPPEHRPHTGQTMGSVEGWSASIASLAEQSNYIAFAIMLALAGPLLAFAGLPEDPAFNLFGATSVGKTSSAKVAASVLGHPDALTSWDISERGLEEAAAAHCDGMIVLNAAERASPKRRREVLNRVIHMAAERASTVRSNAVQEQLPNLTWRTIVLSTSNKSGAQMAAEAGLLWDLQEAVRFIDIPIPPAQQGGIFDRLGAIQDRAGQSTKLIHDLERALQHNYGVLLRPWIDYLLKISPEERVAELMARFDRKTGLHKGLEDRVARKFAVVYAAGKMAVEAGLLKWPPSLPLSATRTLMARASSVREGKDSQLEKALATLALALNDEDHVYRAVPGKSVMVRDENRFLGIRYRQAGRDLIGLRKEGLSGLLGPAMVDPVLDRLRRCDALQVGHGGKSTQQVPFVLRIGSATYSKPRFLVLETRRLKALVSNNS